MEPTRAELLEVTLRLVIHAEKAAWDGFSVWGDSDAQWRMRLAKEQSEWSELINLGRQTLQQSGVAVLTPLEIKDQNRRKREEERERESQERKQRLDAKRCKSCGSASGHKKGCLKRKK